MVMDVKAALARAKAELDQARAQFEAAQAKMTRLEAMRDGLQIALEEYDQPEVEGHEAESADSYGRAEPEGGPSETDEPREPTLDRLPGIPDPPARDGTPSQVDLAWVALNALGSTAKTNQVKARVAAAGYEFRYDQIRGALSWLEHQGRVARTAPGTWAVATVTAPTPTQNGAVRRP